MLRTYKFGRYGVYAAIVVLWICAGLLVIGTMIAREPMGLLIVPGILLAALILHSVLMLAVAVFDLASDSAEALLESKRQTMALSKLVKEKAP